MRAVILGAGPAGTACAIQLLKTGFEVAIIECQKFPRDLPGETLHPGVEPLLKQLEILDAVEKKNFIRQNGISLFVNGEENLQFYNEKADWRGFQLYRRDFDTILLRKSIALGAEYLEATSSREIIQDNGTIKAIVTDSGAVFGDIFIDATGRKAWLARRLKIGFDKRSRRLFVYYGYVRSTENESFKNPLMIWDRTGWTWIARITKEIVGWNRISICREFHPTANWLPKQVEEFPVVGKIKAADVTWRIAKKVSDKNYFLIGDSAFVLDPSSSQGVIKAIMSGIMVAHLLKAERDGFKRAQIHHYYENWLNQWFESNVESLKELYKNNGLNL